MAGNTIGRHLTLTTFGESHGRALGMVLDAFPAGMALSEDDIRPYLDRRKPGTSAFTTARKEADEVEILSGVFEGKTTGTPIAMLVRNTDAHSADYDSLKDVFRPGHADFGYAAKYGLRDHRGGGRASGRETVSRVMAGAVCAKLLKEMQIDVCAYTKSIGDITIDPARFDRRLIYEHPLAMPDPEAAKKAEDYVSALAAQKDSAGGVVECVITKVPAGIGDPVFDKLDARFAEALMSIGAVKAVECGDGASVSLRKGSENNDAMHWEDGAVRMSANHAGGITGGITNGADILLRAHIKPTPSIAAPQRTAGADGQEHLLEIKGRHDPVIVPRAVVVVEAMCAFTLLDAMLFGMAARAKDVRSFYRS